MYDVIIIGAGPAGMTAAIYTARKKLNTLVLAKELGGQMAWSNDVENYTGFSMVSGADLALKFKEHLESIPEDLELKTGVEITALEKNITSFQVEDSAGQLYHSRAVIIASGKNPRHLDIPGEKKFFGHGVSVCATCDGPLCKGKTVAVIGGGNSALDAILSLSKVARQVYVINVDDTLGGEEIVQEKVLRLPNAVFYNGAQASAIEGTDRVTGVTIKQIGKPDQTLAVDAVFEEVGYIPSNDFDLLSEKNERGEIIVDGNMQTKIPGLFAAGDINNVWGEQIVIAAGEGAKAAMAVSDYLNKLR